MSTNLIIHDSPLRGVMFKKLFGIPLPEALHPDKCGKLGSAEFQYMKEYLAEKLKIPESELLKGYLGYLLKGDSSSRIFSAGIRSEIQNHTKVAMLNAAFKDSPDITLKYTSRIMRYNDEDRRVQAVYMKQVTKSLVEVLSSGRLIALVLMGINAGEDLGACAAMERYVASNAAGATSEINLVEEIMKDPEEPSPRDQMLCNGHSYKKAASVLLAGLIEEVKKHGDKLDYDIFTRR